MSTLTGGVLRVNEDLVTFLEEKVNQYNTPLFIENDPISIPHGFRRQQDIEISGFFAAILAWGQRKTIINKCRELMGRMDNSPYEFIRAAKDSDLRVLEGFCHRTFNDTDLLHTVSFLQRHYAKHESLQSAFFPETSGAGANSLGKVELKNIRGTPLPVELALIHFKSYFFDSPDAPARTQKHISSPLNKSTCKRLNMFLRWMVRRDDQGVDFGIWNAVSPADLIIPYDVHVDRVARHLGLVQRKQRDWLTTLELTQLLAQIDPKDPVKFDFALFGMGVIGDF